MQFIPASIFKMEPKKIARILTQNNMNKELKVTAGFPPLHYIFLVILIKNVC